MPGRLGVTIAGVTIECLRGDITQQPDLDCIANAANAELISGGGVAGAIHRAAGPGLATECRPLAPIRPGEAVISGGHRLPNRWIVHCLGPVWGQDEPADALLASCYRNALRLAAEKSVTTIGFPAISTGIFGFPVQRAAEVALAAVLGEATRLANLRRIRFVLFSEADRKIHADALARLAGTQGQIVSLDSASAE